MPEIGMIKGDTVGGLSPDDVGEILGEDESPFALPVEHNGPITTRVLPNRHGVATNFQIAPGAVVPALNADPRRARTVLLCAIGIASYGTTTASVRNGRGFIFPLGASVELHSSEPVFLGNPHATDVATVSIVTENWAD